MVLKILIEGNEVLNKVCNKVKKIDEKIINFLDDMKETMYANGGVGLAAPQIGVLLRVVVIDTGKDYFELINPKIIKTSGEQRRGEGCLSCPGSYGITVRPAFVVVSGLNRNNEMVSVEGTGLKARAICHEVDHLDGILFKSRLAGKTRGSSKLFWKK